MSSFTLDTKNSSNLRVLFCANYSRKRTKTKQRQKQNKELNKNPKKKCNG